MLYAAVIGDMAGSRKLADRDLIQKRFLDLIKAANREFSSDIASPFTVTIGDEFQVLLHRISSAPKIIHYIREGMSPVQLAFGVGIGPLSTDLNREMAIGMDGPVFHHARAAVERAKKKKPTVVYASAIPGTDLITSLQYFIESCENGRTQRQKQIIALLQSGQTQEKIGETLHITQQDVSKVLKGAFLPEITEANRTLHTFLEQVQSLSDNNNPPLY